MFDRSPALICLVGRRSTGAERKSPSVHPTQALRAFSHDKLGPDSNTISRKEHPNHKCGIPSGRGDGTVLFLASPFPAAGTTSHVIKSPFTSTPTPPLESRMRQNADPHVTSCEGAPVLFFVVSWLIGSPQK